MPKNMSPLPSGVSATEAIDDLLAGMSDWRGDVLRTVRQVILAADAGVIEEWKWGIPVWSCDGIICTGETYKNHVKLTFAKGASLPDPAGLFTSSLEGRVRRAIDYSEGDAVKARPLTTLVRAAIKANRQNSKKTR